MNIDTMSVAVYGKGTELFDFGYSRDNRPDLMQVNFDATELRGPINIPFHLSVDKGNTSDSVQFMKIVDDIISNLRDDSLFVFDAGGDAKQILDRITAKNMRSITRKRLNKSDYLWISRFDKDQAYCVDRTMECTVGGRLSNPQVVQCICSIQRNCTATRWSPRAGVRGDASKT